MGVIEQLMETKNRIIKQKLELQEYLSLQFKNYRSILVQDPKNGFDRLGQNNDNEDANDVCSDPINFFERAEPHELISSDEYVYTSDWVFVSQDMIDAFAIVTLDDQWIHTDIYRAQKESPFKSTIAHGFLILSLIPHLTSTRDLHAVVGQSPRMIFNLGLKNVHFLHPLKSNLAIRARIKTLEIQPQKRGVQLTEEISIESKSGKTICRADTIYRVVFH
ncbi:MAG: hypothetical protein B0W54_15015 [Cellvibrio sp. 79]|nr:MAG: hypothetical protein B0W54_15015 [Cellvibrio sp. 79]